MTLNPIIAKATIETVGREDEDAAAAREASESRAALDDAELRALERAENQVVAPKPPTKVAGQRRSLLDRLLGRGGQARR